ncbi:YybH family protein [Nocardioides nitrophenolicus]|uniref:YybH family protein n=1 Tax=Nocardioides nitrophenolicus TaxID=60489 RepID=UPI001957363B|nr:nuclear transport factor 2 family protein [Nocardioides nitrophenolicus]MBM7517506.1 ketosteroid isomerase-like protein [Nocardioides nitrophenolicus]
MGSHNSVTEINELFVEAMNEGDLDLALSCWDERTVFQTAPGTAPVTGLPALREALQAFIDTKPHLTVEELHRVDAGDVVLVALRWQLTGTGPDGEPVEMEAVDSNVFCREPDGTWRIRIDNPFHSAHLGL